MEAGRLGRGKAPFFKRGPSPSPDPTPIPLKLSYGSFRGGVAQRAEPWAFVSRRGDEKAGSGPDLSSSGGLSSGLGHC